MRYTVMSEVKIRRYYEGVEAENEAQAMKLTKDMAGSFSGEEEVEETPIKADLEGC